MPCIGWVFLKVHLLWFVRMAFQIACQMLVASLFCGVKMTFPCWITLYRGQVAAVLIKSCTMVWNNDEAESLTIGECHEIATMSLHKATGPFSLYDTWKGNQILLANRSWTWEITHETTNHFFGVIFFLFANNLWTVFPQVKPMTFKTILAFKANIYQNKVMFGMVAISTW